METKKIIRLLKNKHIEKTLFNLIALIFISAPIITSLVFSITWGVKKHSDKSLPNIPPEIKIYTPAKSSDYKIWREKLSFGIEEQYNYDNPADYISISASGVIDTSSTSAISVRLIPPFN